MNVYGENNFEKIQELLRQRAELMAKLNLLPYDGTPEIKENASGKYIYLRKRDNGKLTSKYVDKYSDTLYQLLLKNSKEAKELRNLFARLKRFGKSGIFCKRFISASRT